MLSIHKILIVEDSRLLHRVYGRALQPYLPEGSRLLHAYSGMEALAILKDEPDTDLILLDTTLPGMSGLEFLNCCRREDRLRSIPVMIISTEDQDDDIHRGLNAGANGYLTKPFRVEDLHSLIEQIFSKPECRCSEATEVLN